MTKTKYLHVAVADFETTGEENWKRDGYVRVWLYSLRTLWDDKEYIGTTLDEFMKLVFSLNLKKVWFHNLSWDGTFILDYLLKHGYSPIPPNFKVCQPNDFMLMINEQGQWFKLQVGSVQFRDSLKKYPRKSVKDLGYLFFGSGKEEYDDEDYEKYRPLDYIPSAKDIKYCSRDTEIIAAAIKECYNNHDTCLTLPGDAWSDLTESLDKKVGRFKGWRDFWPVLDESSDLFARQAYQGGWCYCNKTGEFEHIYVYDVNSLYPTVMLKDPLPFGKGYYTLEEPNSLYFIRVKAEFKVKDGMLPFLRFSGRQAQILKYQPHRIIKESNGITELYLTSVDWNLMLKHYDVDVCSTPLYLVFDSKIGLCSDYLDYWFDVKRKSDKGSTQRELAKGRLNFTYGKTGMRRVMKNKVPYLKDNHVAYKNPHVEGNFYTEYISEIEPVYVPYAAFVTAWARYRTISAAQLNFDSLIYSDTDSIHLTKPAFGIQVDDKDLGAWKCESPEGGFDIGRYLGPKVYAHFKKDHSLYCDGELDVKGAGMTYAMKQQVTYDNFHLGTEYFGLKRTTVPGGCILRHSPHKLDVHMDSRGW